MVDCNLCWWLSTISFLIYHSNPEKIYYILSSTSSGISMIARVRLGKFHDVFYTAYQVLSRLLVPVPRYLRKLEIVARRCSMKKLFLKISLNSMQNTCAGVSFLIKLQTYSLQLYRKRDSGAGIFLQIL